MSFPLYDNGAISGPLIGLLFGFVLEGAGFGSPRKLTGQFTLRDFAVFKMMLTAVIVAGFGLWVLEDAGIMGSRSVYIPTLFFWSIAAGGLLIGTGFAVGGYCPGTSLAGLASGRLDALVFVAGMVVGVGLFAGVFESLKPFYTAAEGPEGQTLAQFLGIPVPVILVLMSVAAAAGIALARRIERSRGGVFEVQEVLADARSTQP